MPSNELYTPHILTHSFTVTVDSDGGLRRIEIDNTVEAKF